MDDDDWGLSLEELDSLERNAAAQLANRNKCSSSTAPIVLDSDLPKRTPQSWNQSSSSTAPIVLESDSPKTGPPNWNQSSSSTAVAPTPFDSPKKRRLDADVVKTWSSPQKNAGAANRVCASSPTKTSNVTQGVNSPQKNVGDAVNRIYTSPTKRTGRELKVKLFRDEPGKVAVESPYHPVSLVELAASTLDFCESPSSENFLEEFEFVLEILSSCKIARSWPRCCPLAIEHVRDLGRTFLNDASFLSVWIQIWLCCLSFLSKEAVFGVPRCETSVPVALI